MSAATLPACEGCQGTGMVCSACGHAFDDCECLKIHWEEPPEGAECEACGGSGEARTEG